MTKQERSEFRGYLRQCTDRQVYGVLEKERNANRETEIELATAELDRRGLAIEE